MSVGAAERDAHRGPPVRRREDRGAGGLFEVAAVMSVIFGSISVLMVATLGDQAAGPRGLSTILFIMAATALLFAACCYAVGRFHLSRVLELLPFPVVCGFQFW